MEPRGIVMSTNEITELAPSGPGANLQTPFVYLLTAVSSVILAILALDLWGADFRIPFYYSHSGDVFFFQMLIKTIIDHGWFLHNPDLGAPTGLFLHDFPLSDNLTILILKFIILWAPNSGLVLNLYFLLTYPLTAVTSLWALRKLGISNCSAVAGSVLFAFSPYHHFRGEHHLFLSSYFQIPLLIVITFWIARGEPFLPAEGGRWRWLRSKAFVAIVICVMAASQAVYYAYFAAFLFMVTGVTTSLRRKNLRHLLMPILLSGALLVTLLANLTPSLLYFHQNGKSDVIKRHPTETDVYGLKLAQVLLPVPNHRLPFLAQVRRQYDEAFVDFNNENQIASVGAVASIGLLLLLGHIFGVTLPARDPQDVWHLIRLSLAAFLLATVGGLGSLVSTFVSAQIRGYNRISIFIAFFAIVFLAMLFDGVSEKTEAGTKWPRARWIGALLIVVIGILDQVASGLPVAASREAYQRDAAFASKLEAHFPEGTMVFQLPYAPFPNCAVIHRMACYDSLIVYFHSKSLRWSYGAMLKSDGDKWLRQIYEKKGVWMLEEIAKAGFGAIYVDRFGYRDNANALMESVQKMTGREPIMSDDMRLAAFPLENFLQEPLSPDDSQAGIVVLDARQRVEVGNIFELNVRMTNYGTASFRSHVSHPVSFSYHWRAEQEGGENVFDGERSPLPAVVAGGETVTAKVHIVAPSTPGRYQLQLSLVQERVRWFEDVSPELPAVVEVEVR